MLSTLWLYQQQSTITYTGNRQGPLQVCREGHHTCLSKESRRPSTLVCSSLSCAANCKDHTTFKSAAAQEGLDIAFATCAPQL